jgi:hypothetical protein
VLQEKADELLGDRLVDISVVKDQTGFDVGVHQLTEAGGEPAPGRGACPIGAGGGTELEAAKAFLGDRFTDATGTDGGLVIGVYGLSPDEFDGLAACGMFAGVVARPVSAAAMEAAQDLVAARLTGLAAVLSPDWERGVVVAAVAAGDLAAAVEKAGADPELAAMVAVPAGSADLVGLEFKEGQAPRPDEIITPPGDAMLSAIALSPDLTGDGLGDLIGIQQHSNWLLVIYPGTPAGFRFPGFDTGLSGLANARVYGPGDWSGDGKADVAVVDSAGFLWLHRGDGRGGVPEARTRLGNGWSDFTAIPAGDLTGDGQPDLLGVDNRTGLLYLYRWQPAKGVFAMKQRVGNGWTGWQLHAGGDLNGDGRGDILGIDPAGFMYCYHGRGDGTFLMKQRCGNGWGDFYLAAGADLDGDGLADIVGRDNTSRAGYFYKGLGNGRFAMKKQLATGW